jgi:hypothetical protein
MMGHLTIRSTQQYARITDRKIKEEMEKVAEKLNTKPPKER